MPDFSPGAIKYFSLAVIYFLIYICLLDLTVQAQSYEDKRCKCVCPSPSVTLNNTQIYHFDRTSFITNVPPNKCNCDGVIIPRLGHNIKGKEQEFCHRCECIYENRNTTIIKVVVIIVVWVITLLVVYMGFLICLDPLLNKRTRTSYQEHTDEDDDGFSNSGHQMGIWGNVLNRFGHQQDKWKQQVREQRRNIYDRHTMLN